METRVAMIGIIIEEESSVDKMNAILHEYRQYIIGRMGLPYEKRKVALISVMMDAPEKQISALSGKIGSLPHVTTKTLYSYVFGETQ